MIPTIERVLVEMVPDPKLRPHLAIVLCDMVERVLRSEPELPRDQCIVVLGHMASVLAEMAGRWLTEDERAALDHRFAQDLTKRKAA